MYYFDTANIKSTLLNIQIIRGLFLKLHAPRRKIKRRIRQLGLLKEDVARLTGISQATLYTWFNTENIFSKKLEKMSEVLKLDYLSEFMGSKKNEEYEVMRKDRDDWKEKYYALMDKYNACLENANILNKKFKLKQST